ncbi:hypothetical protein SNE25_18310 [Mucilaginibacter sabulilitoris]|uniref:Uncharacterized protein n=1 Tax=Mucilaginibacter sabulilitoris TaxID=1173583 RepID=A0ABZ0TE61_9SPHI|nr:hypothetical protein [Mucilaginibacter sabulilitoris]WPU91273.1 hypothetical protein SNE25_18310 [Mucilaginibacter sabulilitoris]
MSQNNNLKRSLIPQSASKVNTNPKFIDKNAALMKGWQSDGDKANVLISIKFIQHDFQCFSGWQKDEMNLFWDFSRRIHESTWSNIYSQSGKLEKTGFGITNISRGQYPKSEFINSLSPDIGIVELRVSKKMRVHGFRFGAIFYLCFLDRNHEICP